MHTSAWWILSCLLLCCCGPQFGADANTQERDASVQSDAHNADAVNPDTIVHDAAVVTPRCPMMYDRVTLRSIDQRRYLAHADGPVSAVHVEDDNIVRATIVGTSIELRARAAGRTVVTAVTGEEIWPIQVDVQLEPSLFVNAVENVHYGEGAGYGQNYMPDIVCARPNGRGLTAGSVDVVSLGIGGSITLAMAVDIVDGPGIDFVVFENAFVGFVEAAEVAVSEDGSSFVPFACAINGDLSGCAGQTPVFANPDNGLDPSDWHVAGGDAFDLADIGLHHARYVRITDVGGLNTGGGMAGFDLDALVAVNSVPVSTTALLGPSTLELSVGENAHPRFDVQVQNGQINAVATTCRIEPADLLEITCDCLLAAQRAGSGTLHADLGALHVSVAVTVNP